MLIWSIKIDSVWYHLLIFIFARLALPPVGVHRMELYLFCGSVIDREMTSWYFPARVESRGFRWNVTMLKARGGSITFQFSGSVYSPCLASEEVRAGLRTQF